MGRSMAFALIAAGAIAGGARLRHVSYERPSAAAAANVADSPPSIAPDRSPSATALRPDAPTVSVDPPTVAVTSETPRPAPPPSPSAGDGVATNLAAHAASSGTPADATPTKAEDSSRAKPKPSRSRRHLRRDRSEGTSNEPAPRHDVEDETQTALDALAKAQLERSLL